MVEYDEQGRPICGVCKKNKRNLFLEPSRNQLLFGGFNMRREYRCPDCERKVARWIDGTLRQLEKDAK